MTAYAFTADGKIQPPSLEELIKADKNSVALAYTDGMTQDGKPFYAYIAVLPSKYQEFYMKSAAKEPLVIGEYGTIIESDFEAKPPQEVVQRMRDMGFDDNYEEKIRQEAKRQFALHAERQEASRIDDIVQMLKRKPSNPAN